MRKSISKPVRLIPTAGPDSQGITGLETAIVLIAFVVVWHQMWTEASV